MAIRSFTNYAAIPGQGYGLPGDLLSRFVEGYKAQRMPSQMRTAEQQQQELVKQLLFGNQKAGLELEHLPQKLQDEAQKRATELEFQRPVLEAGLEEQILKNQIEKATGMRKAEAGVGLTEAQAEAARRQAQYAHLAHLTPAQREAADTFGLGTPEYYEQLRLHQGVRPHPTDAEGNPLPLPKGAETLRGMGANERLHATERMEKNVERAESARLANQALDGIEGILQKYPNLNKSWSYVLTGQQDSKAYQRAIKGLNLDEQTGLDLLTKYSNQLALYQSEAGSSRATNLYRQMVQATKPGLGMTDPAIRQIIKEIKMINSPLINYADQVAPFMHTHYIPYQAKNFKTAPTNEITANMAEKLSSQQEMPGGSTATFLFKVGNQHVRIPANEVAEFREENPTAVEVIK